jgi:acyl-coenzyme A synthetase/AMP-(fatty) acid ligase
VGIVTPPLAFATSGSTGEPVSWLRTAEQIVAEARLLAELTAPDDVDGVVCFAPPRHLYGYLMGLALPQLLGVPCWYVSLTESPKRVVSRLRRPVIATVPAAMATLSRSLPALRRLDEVVLVHGSAVLPPDAGRIVAALDGRARMVELFGSTETGLVASRATAGAPWTPATDVAVAAGQAGVPEQLRVRSPRLAHRPGGTVPAELKLDDIVTVRPDGTFDWHGRRSRMVKVNGRRVYLDEIEAFLRDAAPGAVSRCEAHPDDLRGEWFTVLVDSAGSQGLAEVEQACRALPAWQRPSSVGHSSVGHSSVTGGGAVATA